MRLTTLLIATILIGFTKASFATVLLCPTETSAAVVSLDGVETRYTYPEQRGVGLGEIDLDQLVTIQSFELDTVVIGSDTEVTSVTMSLSLFRGDAVISTESFSLSDSGLPGTVCQQSTAAKWFLPSGALFLNNPGGFPGIPGDYRLSISYTARGNAGGILNTDQAEFTYTLLNTSSEIEGDLNDDGKVDVADLLLLQQIIRNID